MLSITLRSPGAVFNLRKNHGEFAAVSVVTMPNACGLPRKRAFGPVDDVSLLSHELDQSVRHAGGSASRRCESCSLLRYNRPIPKSQRSRATGGEDL